jgi:hypothetical protein
MSAYAYWEEKDDHFRFGYTPHRQADGKFHTFKWKDGIEVKDIAFGKRGTARARALQWYHKRVEAIAKMAENPKSRFKPRPQLTPVVRRAIQVQKNLRNAAKRKKELAKIMQQSGRGIAAAETRYNEWVRKEKRWLKEFNELERKKGQERTH